jgi:hypothetical protein
MFLSVSILLLTRYQSTGSYDCGLILFGFVADTAATTPEEQTAKQFESGKVLFALT